jgi:23S rRNA (adenine2030-N6)-methyltransferase
MNYRHAYHAGNFADIIKHCACLMIVEHLQRKKKGAFVLDAHAGGGAYDLSGDRATRTGEADWGIARLMQHRDKVENADLLRYCEHIVAWWALNSYPGSPLLIANQLREQDTLFANELEIGEYNALCDNLNGYKDVKIFQQDAYEAIRAHTPPVLRRGLVLIDPPFEKRDEFTTLTTQMRQWHKRWANGIYMIWYPIKAGLEPDLAPVIDQARGWRRAYRADFIINDREMPGQLNGCGLLILNTPYQLDARLGALSAELTQYLGYGRLEGEWLT